MLVNESTFNPFPRQNSNSLYFSLRASTGMKFGTFLSLSTPNHSRKLEAPCPRGWQAVHQLSLDRNGSMRTTFTRVHKAHMSITSSFQSRSVDKSVIKYAFTVLTPVFIVQFQCQKQFQRENPY